jgi:hypothetical protein
MVHAEESERPLGKEILRRGAEGRIPRGLGQRVVARKVARARGHDGVGRAWYVSSKRERRGERWARVAPRSNDHNTSRWCRGAGASTCIIHRTRREWESRVARAPRVPQARISPTGTTRSIGSSVPSPSTSPACSHRSPPASSRRWTAAADARSWRPAKKISRGPQPPDGGTPMDDQTETFGPGSPAQPRLPSPRVRRPNTPSAVGPPGAMNPRRETEFGFSCPKRNGKIS